MLIIPAIHLDQHACRHTPVGEEGTSGLYPSHPVELVRMWRGENAKALAIFDEEGMRTGRVSCPDLVADMVRATDIPIILHAGFVEDNDVHMAVSRLGCYRVAVPEAVADPERIQRLIELLGPRKLSVAVRLDPALSMEAHGAPALRALSMRLNRLREAGLERVMLKAEEWREGPPIFQLLHLTTETALSFTLFGGIRGYSDLARVQKLAPRRVDSLVLGEVLYANAFPCQRIWRMAEKPLLLAQQLI